MISTPFCIIGLLSGCSLISALTLNLTPPISSPQALNATLLTTPANALPSNTGLGADPTCNGIETGVGLTDGNCHDAIAHSIPGVTEKTVLDYGDRRVGSFDVNLPQRYISGEHTLSRLGRCGDVHYSQGDGRCVVDVTVQDVHKSTPYYPFGIALVATSVLAECIHGHNPPEGGSMEGFGMSSHQLGLVLLLILWFQITAAI